MIKDLVKEILQKESQAILAIPNDEEIEKAVNLIHHHVHEMGGKIILSGMGKAGQIGLNMATTFCSSGSPAIYVHPSEAQHGDLGVIQTNDIIFLISNSGKTREIIEFVELSGRLYNNPIIVMTKGHNTDLATIADVSLSTGNPQEVCPLGLTPTTSTTCMTVLGDIIVVALMKKIGFSNTEYAKRHHGGYLGQKSKEKSKKEIEKV